MEIMYSSSLFVELPGKIQLHGAGEMQDFTHPFCSLIASGAWSHCSRHCYQTSPGPGHVSDSTAHPCLPGTARLARWWHQCREEAEVSTKLVNRLPNRPYDMAGMLMSSSPCLFAPCGRFLYHFTLSFSVRSGACLWCYPCQSCPVDQFSPLVTPAHPPEGRGALPAAS